jgi:hypothetical protein
MTVHDATISGCPAAEPAPGGRRPRFLVRVVKFDDTKHVLRNTDLFTSERGKPERLVSNFVSTTSTSRPTRLVRFHP